MNLTKDGDSIRGFRVILISFVLFICIGFFLKLLYSIPLKDSLLWYVGVFLYFYIPGSLLLRCLSSRSEEYFISLFHSIALGVALIPLLYTVLRMLFHPELIYVLGIVMFFVWLVLTIKDIKQGRINIYTSFSDIQSVLVLIVAVFILLHLSYFTDVIFTENGLKVRNIYLNETFFHLGIVNMIKDTFPPIFPYASTINYSYYHINMHLEIEMFNRLFSMDTLKLTFFFFPLLYFSLLVFVPFIFIRKSMGTRFVGVLTGILIFGSDLSFIPGLLGIFPPDIAWNTLFNSTVWPLLTLNANLPALVIMFLCILYFKKYYEDGRLLYLIVFAILGFSAYGFKSSMGFHIMGASFLTGIASIVLMKDNKRATIVIAVSALTIMAMAADAFLFRGGTGNNIFSIELFNRLHNSLKILGISKMPWFFYPLIFPIFTLAAFSIRALGFYLLKDVFVNKYYEPVFIYIVIFTISGFFLSDLIFLGPLVPPLFRTNNAMWFSIQSLMAAWLLLSYFLMRKGLNGKRFWGIVVLVILLSTPSTVQFLSLRFNHKYSTINSHAMELVRYLKTTPVRSVVLHPIKASVPSLASNLTGRPSVLSLFQSYVVQNIGKMETKNRVNDIDLFFDTSKVTNRSSILKKYEVDYVYAPVSYAVILDKEPMLSQVIKNSGYVLYKVNSSNNYTT